MAIHDQKNAPLSASQQFQPAPKCDLVSWRYPIKNINRPLTGKEQRFEHPKKGLPPQGYPACAAALAPWRLWCQRSIYFQGKDIGNMPNCGKNDGT